MALDRQDCSLQQLVEQALQQVRFLSERKNIRLETRIALDLAARINPEMIQRVFVNLLTNAIKYTPNNGRIDLIGHADATGMIRVEVRDSGVGITADQLDRVFDKFVQVKALNSGAVRSTGIGLTFCKLAVEAHGGQIGVTSELGTGTSFWLTLPAATTLAPPVLADATSAASKLPASVVILSHTDCALLGPLLPMLAAHEIYQYSELRRIFKRADFPSSAGIDAWKAQLVRAVDAGNQTLFDGLLALAAIEA